MNQFQLAKRLIIVLLIPSAALSAQSPVEERLRACAAEVSNVRRLECFDRITSALRSARTKPSESPADKVGAWMVIRQRDLMDDSELVALVSVATSGAAPGKEPPALALMCSRSERLAVIRWGEPLQFDDEEIVLGVRFGSAPAVSQTWLSGSDITVTSSLNTDRFIKTLLLVSTLTVRASALSGGGVTAVFSLDGIDVAMQEFPADCRSR
jgi:type VI secretion system VasI family protein